MADPSPIFARLMQVIESRKQGSASPSYTRTLLDGGVEAIGAKLREEADEVVNAASRHASAGRHAVVHESADLLYHLFVMMAHCGVTLADVESELARRFGTSGLVEKARRAQ